ncbi:hypothetical protein P4641_08635 [Halalkalibacterium halodurans]|uniref:hypothetical protein n=1 Tax=Halalkalibacterium halodurans TaxID=86665 RepID=UPI002E1D4BC3|nr:hypothetical protein [Halalkalibacterium halodurans]
MESVKINPEKIKINSLGSLGPPNKMQIHSGTIKMSEVERSTKIPHVSINPLGVDSSKLAATGVDMPHKLSFLGSPDNRITSGAIELLELEKGMNRHD